MRYMLFVVFIEHSDLRLCVFLQLFKRRNVATVEEDGTLEDDGMSDSGYLESQANNMDQITVRKLKH